MLRILFAIKLYSNPITAQKLTCSNNKVVRFYFVNAFNVKIK